MKLNEVIGKLDNRIKDGKSRVITIGNYTEGEIYVIMGEFDEQILLEFETDNPYEEIYKALKEKYNSELEISRNLMCFYTGNMLISKNSIVIFDYTTSSGQRWLTEHK